MKKVLMVIDGKNFPVGACDFVRQMHENQTFLLTGLFLPSVEFTELLYSFGGMTGPIYVPTLTKTIEEEINSSIEKFTVFCDKNDIEFRIHNTATDNVVTEIRKESRYADLMVLGSQVFYRNLGKERQHEYLLHVLHQAECPVMLIPDEYVAPETVVITFDGSASSVYALRQFPFYFPELTEKKAIMVHAANTSEKIPDWDYAEELIARHYPGITIHPLVAQPTKYFDSWLMDNKNPIVVTGAYSRSFISELLKKSFVDEVIEDHKIPVFVAHK